MEGQCHSGEHQDCHGHGNLITCCHGHLGGQDVGPTEVNMTTISYQDLKFEIMQECSWEYAGHGVVLECGRSDEIVTGRCGSGENRGTTDSFRCHSKISNMFRLPGRNFSWESLL